RYAISRGVAVGPAKIWCRRYTGFLDDIQLGRKGGPLVIDNIERASARLPIKIIAVSKTTCHDLQIGAVKRKTEQRGTSRIGFDTGIATGGFGNVEPPIGTDMNIAKPAAPASR